MPTEQPPRFSDLIGSMEGPSPREECTCKFCSGQADEFDSGGESNGNDNLY